jgi:hypothetical protein
VWRRHRQDKDFVLAKIDLANAFNRLFRSRIDDAIAEFPELARWAAFCYEGDSILWYGDAELRSEEGVQQGDPLGPFIFAAVLQPLIKEINIKFPRLSLNLWYLDDGVLAGSVADVRGALRMLEQLGPEYGFNLNPGKCELVWHAGNEQDELFPPSFAPASSGKRLVDNFSLLGSPIGSAAYCNEWVRNTAVAQGRRLWRALEDVDDMQVRYVLLRHCASAGIITHLLRTVPPELILEATREFDALLCEAVTALLGVDAESAWRQLTLPTSKGGVGIRSARTHAAAAYVASVTVALERDGGTREETEGLAAAWAELQRTTGVAAPPTQQAALSALIDSSHFSALVAGASDDDKCRLLGTHAPSAGAWLNVVPNSFLGQAFSNAEFTILLAWWLGLPVYDKEHQCPMCRKAVCDVKGYHSTTCRNGGNMGVRHNGLRDELFCSSRAARMSPGLEAPFLLPSGCERPADVLLGHRACDLAVTHPAQPRYRTRAAQEEGFASDAYATDVKQRKYALACAAEGLEFVPLVVTVFGEWCSSAGPIFKEISQRIAAVRGTDCGAASAALMQRLSMRLMKGNARALLQRNTTEETDARPPIGAVDEEEEFPGAATEPLTQPTTLSAFTNNIASGSRRSGLELKAKEPPPHEDLELV